MAFKTGDRIQCKDIGTYVGIIVGDLATVGTMGDGLTGMFSCITDRGISFGMYPDNNYWSSVSWKQRYS